MNNLPFLEENLELLLQHTDEIVQVPAYYHSRIMFAAEPKGTKRLGSALLGPFLEFWKQVPVNRAGKLLLTYELLGNTVRNLEMYRELYPDLVEKKKFPQDDLEIESGFRYKKPMPGISRYQLEDIFYRYMLQFNKQNLPMGAPLEMVVQELKEGKLLHERVSQKYGVVREKLISAVVKVTGTNDLYYVPDPTINPSHKFSPDWKPQQQPVTFRVEQEHDMRLTIYLMIEVHVRNMDVHVVTGKRLSATALNDMMLDTIAELNPLLESHGFFKQKTTTSVYGGGLEALYSAQINSPDEVLTPLYLDAFGDLIWQMYAVIKEKGLLPKRVIN
ncbi:hypothetical protein [uncultured Pontibacter sp.]|uniref:hypothetical protein n=1 Tax=uncultured Pontibacter sp. TaxID=453356 RepID=UPI00262E238F|nr:hypothetical protein [uncultured Pontibacter sp.]